MDMPFRPAPQIVRTDGICNVAVVGGDFKSVVFEGGRTIRLDREICDVALGPDTVFVCDTRSTCVEVASDDRILNTWACHGFVAYSREHRSPILRSGDYLTTISNEKALRIPVCSYLLDFTDRGGLAVVSSDGAGLVLSAQTRLGDEYEYFVDTEMESSVGVSIVDDIAALVLRTPNGLSVTAFGKAGPVWTTLLEMNPERKTVISMTSWQSAILISGSGVLAILDSTTGSIRYLEESRLHPQARLVELAASQEPMVFHEKSERLGGLLPNEASYRQVLGFS
jgi:hypothetical protein